MWPPTRQGICPDELVEAGLPNYAPGGLRSSGARTQGPMDKHADLFAGIMMQNCSMLVLAVAI